MTAEPDRLLEQWLAAADAGQLEAFDDFLHSDVVVHAPLGLSSKGLAVRRRRSGEPLSKRCPTCATTCRRS